LREMMAGSHHSVVFLAKRAVDSGAYE